MRLLSLALAAVLCLAAGDAGAYTRIKDITTVVGARDNQLIGYGLVIGLQGSGDSMRNSPFTQQWLQARFDRLGVNVTQENLRVRNVAAVMVTANLPPFANIGTRIDVNVSSIGDATSLNGGTLLMTPLNGADGQVYAVAQGAILSSGFSAAGVAASVSEGVPTDGRIPNGATVEKEVAGDLDDLKTLVLDLQNPDFATATLIADVINSFATTQFGKPVARERDMRTVALTRPANISSVRFLAMIGDLLVYPDAPARVVINQRTGTVVVGQDVRISTVGLTHGSLTVRVVETPVASQPLPFSSTGRTVVLPRTQVTATEQDGHMAIVGGGTSLQTLIDGLNKLGLKPSDIIAILQAIKTAGALQAELVIQ